MTRPQFRKRASAKPEPPQRSLKLALWSLVVTVMILALMLLPYIQRW